MGAASATVNTAKKVASSAWNYVTGWMRIMR